MTRRNLQTGAGGTLRSADGRFADIAAGSGIVRRTADTVVTRGWGYSTTTGVSCSGTYVR
ncbi:hypothetical protein FK268_19535 [Tsukamurella sputi]|uniref:Uncharacterized protein n=1 Tax=Tsukamurella sputi TaxID=2591848 RepID=A0A5C5RI50_9ACTN|nr:hypothetical protein [Tsukamurella sputi]TWS22408.1 hypothetical protein FK268_19535 [Tsukamurella sputi]